MTPTALPDLERPPTERWLLSLAGGGYKGLFTAHFLSRLETELGRPLSEAFDLVAGTSIGSILALGIAAGCKACELEKLLADKGRKIFPAWRRVLPLPVMNLFGARYGQVALKRELATLLKDASMRSLKVPTVIPAVCISNATAKIFRSPHAAGFEQDADRALIDVALASAAAPLYFPAHTIENLQYADGGLIANAPHALAVTEALTVLRWPVKQLNMLAVGTTEVPIGMAVRHGSWKWGLEGWLKDKALINQTMAAQQHLSQQLAQLQLQDRSAFVDAFRSTEQDQTVGLDQPGKQATRDLLSLAEQAWEQFAVQQPARLQSLKRHRPERLL